LKYVLVKILDGQYEPILIVSSMTEAKEIRKIINPDEDEYLICEVREA